MSAATIFKAMKDAIAKEADGMEEYSDMFEEIRRLAFAELQTNNELLIDRGPPRLMDDRAERALRYLVEEFPPRRSPHADEIEARVRIKVEGDPETIMTSVVMSAEDVLGAARPGELGRIIGHERERCVQGLIRHPKLADQSLGKWAHALRRPRG